MKSTWAPALLAATLAATATATAPILTNETSKFTFIDIPHPAAGPCDMATGPDGAEYVQYLFSEKIARIDPETNALTEYDIPFTGPKLPAPLKPVANIALGACVVRAGKDGNIYAANGLRNQLVKLDLATKKVSVFTPPNPLPGLGNLQPFNDMWGAPEGMYYSQTTANIVSLFDYRTHAFKNFQVPTPAAGPLGMRTAYDGGLWFTETLANKIGRLNHTTGAIKEYPLPPSLAGPAVLRVETAGRYIWFTAILSNAVGRMDIYTGETKTYENTAAPAGSLPSEDTIDGAGNVWFCTWTQNVLHKIDPATGAQTHIGIPEAEGKAYTPMPFDIGVGIDYYGLKGKNRMYFSQSVLNRIGYYDLN